MIERYVQIDKPWWLRNMPWTSQWRLRVFLLPITSGNSWERPAPPTLTWQQRESARGSYNLLWLHPFSSQHLVLRVWNGSSMPPSETQQNAMKMPLCHGLPIVDHCGWRKTKKRSISPLRILAASTGTRNPTSPCLPFLTASCRVTRSFGAPVPAFCKAADLITTFPPQQHRDIEIWGMLWYVRYVSKSHAANAFACMRMVSHCIFPAVACLCLMRPTRKTIKMAEEQGWIPGWHWNQTNGVFMQDITPCPENLQTLSQQILLHMKSTCVNAGSSTVTNMMWSPPGAAFSVCCSVLLWLCFSLSLSLSHFLGS